MSEEGILQRSYYHRDGTNICHELCVPKRVLKKNLYRIHNSRTGGPLSNTGTIDAFRKRLLCTNHFEKVAYQKITALLAFH